MILKISALRYKGQSLQSPITATFDEQGGTIGRSPSNQYVLPDEQKVVSGKHATIVFDAGCFYYFDESLNGTRLCTDDRLIHHEKIVLNDQDELSIGDYDLIIHISTPQAELQPLNSDIAFHSMFDNDLNADQASPLSADDDVPTSDIFFPENNPLEDLSNGAAFGDRDFGPEINENFAPPQPIARSPQDSGLPHDLSMEDFFGDDVSDRDFFGEDFFGQDKHVEQNIVNEDHVEEIAQSHPLESPQNQTSQKLTEIIDAPPIKPAKRPSMISKLLEKQNAEGPETPESPLQSAVAQRPVDQGNLAPQTTQLVDVFLEAIGLQDSKDILNALSPEFMRTIGEVFKELVDGLMTILHGRSELKSQLRVSMTVIQKAENNPLKFSPSVEEALKILLAGKSPGFLSGVEAIHEGFEDIKNHQLAITAGVQASLMHILKRFDPAPFEKKIGKGLDPLKKTKCWNEYTRTYQDIVQRALEDFFGPHFVNAYEAQIEKLRQPFKK